MHFFLKKIINIFGRLLGTAQDLTYSFASHDTFQLNTEYYNSINTYTELIANGYDETIFNNPDYQFRTFSEDSKNIVREALNDWSNATGINFVEIDETNGGYGDVRFFIQNFNNWSNIDPFYGDVAGFAYTPFYDSEFDALEGDVYLDEFYVNDASYLSHLVSHEIGHALGLAHPFDGYVIDNSVMEYESVMSYDQSYILANGLMPDDIKAAEFLYGGNSNANIGSNNYVWQDYEDLNFRNSIIDKGGQDTFDFSGQTNGVYVDISPDSWSDLNYNGSETYYDNSAWHVQDGYIYLSSHSDIENVNGSNFDDLILDNNLINLINAGNGNDIIYHFGNSDVIDGGLGTDTLNFKNKSFSDIISISESNQNYIINFNDYQLTVSEIENVIDRDAQGRSFSSLLDEYSSHSPEFTNIFSYPADIYFPFQENQP